MCAFAETFSTQEVRMLLQFLLERKPTTEAKG